ncbi:MAG: hypothetical protein R3B47_20050 [Bacteroidia bacterium]
MSFVSRFKSLLTRRAFKNASSKSAGKIHHDFVDLEEARRVGFIVNTQNTSQSDSSKLSQYISRLKQAGKETFLIEINFQKKSTPAFKNISDGIFINPEKLNWLDLPNHQVETQMLQKELDILMNFDSSPRVTASYLCTLANARTRTGLHVEGQEDCYELMLSLPEANGTKAPSVLDQFDHYLKELVK